LSPGGTASLPGLIEIALLQMVRWIYNVKK
jgi:hypothetical protein